jgi:hypothetical protein
MFPRAVKLIQKPKKVASAEPVLMEMTSGGVLAGSLRRASTLRGSR